MRTEDPIKRFCDHLDEAKASEPWEGVACVLSTVSEDGWPEGRHVLLRGVDPNGFVFYTNRQSAKGKALEAHPRASLCFFWPSVGIQVRVQGSVSHCSEEASDAYFAGRPRDSQLGAWASQQSQTLACREAFEEACRAFAMRFPDVVPRPPHWGGYSVFPRSIEFWYERDFRLHERCLFTRVTPAAAQDPVRNGPQHDAQCDAAQESAWETRLLYP